MTMKRILAIICLFFYAVTSKEIHAKGELSQDVRDKLIEVLNKDRQEAGKKLNITMQVLKYDTNIERSIAWSEDCRKSPSWSKGRILTADSPERDVKKKYRKGYHFFMPSYKTIGCSKDFECSITYNGTVRDKSLIGKTRVHRGICIFGEERKISDEDLKKLKNAKLPTTRKYGDVIELNEPLTAEELAEILGMGSGEALSLIMSLFLVFYI